MTDGLSQQIHIFQHRIDHLLRDGLALHRRLTADPSCAGDLDTLRGWQRECAATISQLSGGSKGHWLSRAYSDAFLLRVSGSRCAPETAVGETSVDTIVERIMSVLRDAQASLVSMHQSASSSDATAPTPRRFNFVHDLSLRPRLEQAFVDAQTALERGEYGLALVTSASMLEAIITDALEHQMTGEREKSAISSFTEDWTFDARIDAAEKARLISAACARLPDIARQYRALLDSGQEVRADAVVDEREAKVTGQVLRLVMRDLAPGR